VGEQDLRGVQAVFGQGFVGLGQAHLADGCGGLQLVHGVRARRPAEALHAGGDGAADETSSTSRPSARRAGDLPRQSAMKLRREAGAVVGDEGAADLDDEAARLTAIFASHRLRFVVVVGGLSASGVVSPRAAGFKRGCVGGGLGCGLFFVEVLHDGESHFRQPAPLMAEMAKCRSTGP
jgi:hypothetical protein